MVALDPSTVAQQADDLKELFFESGGSIHEDAQFEYSESPMLHFEGVPGYKILRGFRKPVRSENVSESWCAQALPIREDETRAMIEHAFPRPRRFSARWDASRGEEAASAAAPGNVYSTGRVAG